jgi:hypothetical protein
LDEAVVEGIPLLPFGVEEVLRSKSFEYFLSNSHTGSMPSRSPLEQHPDRLAENARFYISSWQDEE